MSVNYDGPPAGGTANGGGEYIPPRKVSFEWINEAWRFFSAEAGTWIVSCLVAILLPVVFYLIFAFGFGLTAAFGGQGRGGFGTGGLVPGLPVAMIIFIAAFVLVYSVFYAPFIYSGVYRMATRQVRGESIGIGDIFGGASMTLKMLGFQIILGLIVFVLNVAFIIPLSLLHVMSLSTLYQPNSGATGMPNVSGILISNGVQLFDWLLFSILFLPGYALVADGQGVFSAIKRSISAMKTQVLPTAGIFAVFVLLWLVSAVTCGLGLLVTVPMFWLLSALAYRDVIGMPGAVSTTGAYGVPPGYGAAQSGVWPPPPEARPPAFGQPPSSDPASFSPPRRSLSGEDLDAPEQPPTPPPAA